jgi:hypothetical protein
VAQYPSFKIIRGAFPEGGNFTMGIFDSVTKYFKPISRVDAAKDALKFGIMTGQYIEKNVPTSKFIADGLTKVMGPASPGMINAYDKIAKNWMTGKAVAFANEGGPITKTLGNSAKVANYVDAKYRVSDAIANKLTKTIGPASPRMIDAFDRMQRGGLPWASTQKAPSRLNLPRISHPPMFHR